MNAIFRPGIVRTGLLMAVLVFTSQIFVAGEAQAKLNVVIDSANVQPMPIALPAFQGGNPADAAMMQNITGVISADLERSGLFRPLDPAAFTQSTMNADTAPSFPDWKLINAQALVVGDGQTLPDGRLFVRFRLWDVYAGQTLGTGLQMHSSPQAWRQLAHKIADYVYQQITGESGYFDTRVVYVSESGPELHRIKRLAVMDQDGANNVYLTNGNAMSLTPRFSPALNKEEITYLSYARGTPRVYVYNITSGEREELGNFPGMTFAPRFSPDGNKVIFSLSTGAGSDIYTMDLQTRQVTQLTNGDSAIDTSPCYSPDGQFITFNSDRGGNQQLYVMNADGSNAHRISFGTGRYATPVWSPRGDLIAFTKFEGPVFSIGVMSPDGSGERILTNGYLVEGPTWAPNGRVLMYFRQEQRGGTKLYSIDLTGNNEREVVTPQDASDPAWSPLLP